MAKLSHIKFHSNNDRQCLKREVVPCQKYFNMPTFPKSHKFRYFFSFQYDGGVKYYVTLFFMLLIGSEVLHHSFSDKVYLFYMNYLYISLPILLNMLILTSYFRQS